MKYISLALFLLAIISCQQEADPDNKMETIKYIERASGEIKTENVPSEGMLKWLYTSTTGKAALNLLFKRKIVSAVGGWYMNTGFSSRRIDEFVSEHQIDKKEFEIEDLSKFTSFNDFFYRKLKPNARKIGERLVSPADGKILVFQTLADVNSFFVKGTEFTLAEFLQNEKLASKYTNGAMAIIRLAPPDYHRYHFPASGVASESTKIKGHYYSVSPLALQKNLQIFCENKREHCTLATEDYGNIIIVDVGATMVGSIIQTYEAGANVEKGEEKGYFAFGGSTLVLLFEEGKITFDTDLVENTKKGMETTISMGENIASMVKK
ncbi:phosphatidylserine decarboxylase [uncultured Draconibacterium sp.]|uniref:phosphatidylserine decarboxylase n=1 Tax=uncultured Draconibacterium sp. TaxID=1573823 RepID=UPI002AA630D2|nr:phosphatidylserine decarboxylase [uncultured Draconibacterium sp.]